MHHYVDAAVQAQNLEGVKRVGIDETSSRRGHEYVSVFADLDQRRSVFVVEGRDHETVQAFSLFLETHGGDPGQVSDVCQDMSDVERRLNPAREMSVVLFIGGMTLAGLAGFAYS